MSGGTDSSMAAHLLREAGHDIIGFTLLLVPPRAGTSAERNLINARRAAAKLGIRHEVIDRRDVFETTIVAPFIEAYRRGETPSPCVHCNAKIKFGALLDSCLEMGCSHLATGHYARITPGTDDGTPSLLRGRDGAKDQSYFLFCLSLKQLSRARFPLGDCTKEDVRRRARQLGLVPRQHGESQDLCFIPDGKYPEFIRKRYPELRKAGPITDVHGSVIGEHTGYYQFTIGQRRGLGLGGGPWYVTELVASENRVIVGRDSDLNGTRLSIVKTNWLFGEPVPGQALRACTQLRYNMIPVPCRVEHREAGTALVELSRPVKAITPGQAAVFYDGDRVLGEAGLHGRRERVASDKQTGRRPLDAPGVAPREARLGENLAEPHGRGCSGARRQRGGTGIPP